MPKRRSAKGFPTLSDVRKWSVKRCVRNYHQALVYYDQLPRMHQVAIDAAVAREVTRVDDARAQAGRFRHASRPQMLIGC